MQKTKNLKLNLNKQKILWYLGLCFVLYGFILLVISFTPIIYNEVRYFISRPETYVIIEIDSEKDHSEFAEDENKNDKDNIILAANPNFSIIVPKIGANAPVIANVDPFNEEIYQKELTKGVAHAEGSVFPGQIGTTFLFAHSSTNLYEAKRYNSIFYLLNKLDIGDKFYIVYGDDIYEYEVSETSIVSPDEVNMIDENQTTNIAKLMTCWPAGTNMKRLIVEGKLK